MKLARATSIALFTLWCVVEAQTPPPAPDTAARGATRVSAEVAAFKPTLKKKRQATVAGFCLLAASGIIDYGLILPASNALDSTDIEGQFALLSPMALSFGLRVLGPAMCCMRTSEAAAAYARAYGVKAPRNRTWTLYYCGWGFYAASLGISALGMRSESSRSWQTGALAADILADATWAFAGLYALFYLQGLGSPPVEAAAEAPRLSAVPFVTRGGSGGIACVVRF